MAEYWTTSFQPTGNRWAESCAVSGDGGGRAGPFLFIEQRSTKLAWAIGSQDSAHFLVVDLSGAVHRYHFGDDGSNNVTLLDVSLEPTRPLVAFGDPLQPVEPPGLTSLFSAAIPIDDDDMLYVDSNQVLQHYSIDTNRTVTVDPVSIIDPLVDAHITYSPNSNRWAIYTHSTNGRYVHGILGDSYEGFHLHVLSRDEIDGTFQVANEIILDENDEIVFEGLAPMWTDVDGDGIDDLLTTVSTTGRGAALRVYFLDKEGSVRQQSQSEFIELSGRWLHQLASCPLGPRGEIEIVETRTPHIGGYMRYYRYDAASNQLVNVASTEGDFTTHEIFSRNIDQAIVADLNGDGIPELIVQSADRRSLYGLQRATNGEVARVWSVPLNSPVRSNIAVSCSNGSAQLLFGTENQDLYRVVFQGAVQVPSTPGVAFSSSPSTWPSYYLIFLVGYFLVRW